MTREALALIEFGPLDLERTMRLHRFGLYDPTASLSAHRFEKRFMTAHGPVCCAVEREGASSVTLRVRGERAEEILAGWARTLPPDDGYGTFAVDHPLIARLHRELPGLRLFRAPWIFDIACSVILQQRVAFVDATRDWRRILEHLGERHDGGVAFPSAQRVAKMPSWQLEELGVDPKRARALIALAREQVFHPFLELEIPHAALRARLLSIRGIGPWTTEMIMGFGAGDTDALPTGDLHLPRVIVWALTNEAYGDDARMLALLEPYRPHRFRVSRLLVSAGMDAPRTRDPRPSMRRPF